ncbi:hypothetical protein COV93_06140 [Candidatus Woesearchaeota archaeon CG11_big_fil_rev_8_21_14_0_20_43_8]|nr:MAG: hypothetical protein COV93_06140 [Candidatus Woesearchaeota archaeon CG11_big_fil_rev_8_21_14_0_20_43_8]
MDIKTELEKCSEKELYHVMELLDMGSYDHENKADAISLILAWVGDSNMLEVIKQAKRIAE